MGSKQPRNNHRKKVAKLMKCNITLRLPFYCMANEIVLSKPKKTNLVHKQAQTQ